MTGGLGGGDEVEGSGGGKAAVNGLSLEEDCGVLRGNRGDDGGQVVCEGDGGKAGCGWG